MQAKSETTTMNSKKPFDKDNRTKIPFLELVELIHQDCDYHFAIIDNEIDKRPIKKASQ